MEPDPEEPGPPEEPGSGPPPAAAPCRWFLAGRCRFGPRCRHPHPGAPRAPPPPREDPPGPGKKPPLRPVRDVLNRLRWDPRLDPAAATVGYRDRFRGLLERPLLDLFPGPLSDAGPGDLPVPEHRIQHVSYRGRRLWDRQRRRDRLFGSAGGERWGGEEEGGGDPPGPGPDPGGAAGSG